MLGLITWYIRLPDLWWQKLTFGAVFNGVQPQGLLTGCRLVAIYLLNNCFNTCSQYLNNGSSSPSSTSIFSIVLQSDLLKEDFIHLSHILVHTTRHALHSLSAEHFHSNYVWPFTMSTLSSLKVTFTPWHLLSAEHMYHGSSYAFSYYSSKDFMLFNSLTIVACSSSTELFESLFILIMINHFSFFKQSLSKWSILPH